jgi:hypothetical protein
VEGCASSGDLGDDLVGGGFPDERLGVGVPVLGPVGDGLAEVGDACEYPAAWAFVGDAVAGEPGRGPEQEVGAGRALLVGQNLGVGQPGVVVDGGVDVVVADPSAAGLLAAAVDAPAAAGRDPAELLDVEVDQVPGPVAFVAVGGGAGGADR